MRLAVCLSLAFCLQAQQKPEDLARDILREGAETGRRPRHVYSRAGRACPRCGAAIQAGQQGTELPRRIYWCPRCQGPGPEDA